ncbi:hypothetical protein WJX72_003752 [[Myrmecia] bisecta]|uniref:Uncharacterized protein n=1 Tax=[Myrmecia] bisecta TaxID=41462 RepID=A0AAW1PHM3_9CHLO
MLRINMAAEAAAVRLFAGQQAVLGDRPDVAYMKEQEGAYLNHLQALAPGYRARPSLFGPLCSAAGYAVGAASAVLPRNLAASVTGAVQDALSEEYTDQLRQLHTDRLAAEVGPLRDALRQLRDHERAPDDGVKAPDIFALQRPQDLSMEQGMAALVKYTFKGLFTLAGRA